MGHLKNIIRRFFLKLQGVLMFKDQYRAVMQYSLPRDAGKPGDNGSPRLIHHDWICAKVILNDILIDPRRLRRIF